MGARRKAAAVAAPASRAEAEEMMRDYVALERDQMAARLFAEREIDAAKARRDAILADLESERAGLFAGLKAWWEAGGAAQVAGRKRSAELANATIGIRKTPPAVKFARKVKAADVVAWLKRLRWTRATDFLRVKTDLDKQAIIKAVQQDPGIARMLASHLTIEQADEFFIDCGLDEDALKKDIAAS